jgi:hypothetical protein
MRLSPPILLFALLTPWGAAEAGATLSTPRKEAILKPAGCS